LPAVTEVERLPCPLFDCATVQPPAEPELLPVTTVLLEPPEPPTLTELLELVWAVAIDAPRLISTDDASVVFTIHLLKPLMRTGCAGSARQPVIALDD